MVKSKKLRCLENRRFKETILLFDGDCMERPDLSNVDPHIRAYIEFLEGEIAHTRTSRRTVSETAEEKPVLEPSEPPTTLNLVTLTAQGIAKRTPRHLYGRQRRAGMGIFDLDAPADQKPDFLTIADESQGLILFTNLARAFRFPMNKLPETEVRSRGQSILERIPLEAEETIAAVLPDQASGYIALVSRRGMVRCLRHHLFGDYLRPGTAFYNYREFGPLAAACWTPGDADLFIATQSGLAIRFGEKLVPPQGILGMKVDASDCVVAVTAVRDDSGVFLIGADGRGTVRQMAGFNPNKSPGGSGKLAMKADEVVSAVSVEPTDDIFIITSLGKIIRFAVDDVPPTEGVIQGVNCINMRADEVSAAIKSSTISTITYRSV